MQIVEQCDTRLGETEVEELAKAVTETLPPPPTQPGNQEVEESETVTDGDPQRTDKPDEGEAEDEIKGKIDSRDDNLMDAS